MATINGYKVIEYFVKDVLCFRIRKIRPQRVQVSLGTDDFKTGGKVKKRLPLENMKKCR